MPIPEGRQLLPFYVNFRLVAFTDLPLETSRIFFHRAPAAARCAHRPPGMRVATNDLMAMKVNELKEELSAREEATSGNKSWLRRRLHAAIVREYLDGAMADEGE